MTLDLNKSKNLNNVSAIYIGGGNTYKLLKLMKESGFLPVLKKYIQNGGIIYGASAGAVLMGKKISTYIENKYLLENKKNKYTITKGMALMGNYSIITHFNKEDYFKIKEYFKKNNNPIIAIPEGIGLMLKDNYMKVIGDKAVYIFKKNGVSKKITPNMTFEV
jgi:dipeptidase E